MRTKGKNSEQLHSNNKHKSGYNFNDLCEVYAGLKEFVFVNNGNKPLKIESTQGSCGCTVPTKPEGDIAPGAKGKIGVKYATDRVGPFTKTVTIKSNAVGQETKVVTIKGTVLPDAPADGAAPTKS